MFGFGTSLLALAYAALSMGSIPLAAAGPTAGIERPYTNAEAIRRGLPLLKPRQPCEGLLNCCDAFRNAPPPH